MKNLLITCALILLTAAASAQQDGQQPSDDQLQQQPAREPQARIERAANVEAVKSQSNNEIDAEKAAKNKGQTQNQTKTQPTGLNPRDAEARPTDPKKIITE